MTLYDRALEHSSSLSKKLRGNRFRPSIVVAKSSPVETELTKIIVDKNQMVEWSEKLEAHFLLADDQDVHPSPNAIPEISDFSNIVVFAESADGMPFCFDFRNNEKTPSIIWWDDDHWVRISNNLSEFINLFTASSSNSV